MSHKHVGPDDEACTGCIGDLAKKERCKAVAGVILLIALVIGGMIGLSMWLSSHGSHLG